MFNTVNQGQSVTNNYAVVQIGFRTFRQRRFQQNLSKTNGNYSSIFRLGNISMG